ncbi:MAG: tRNA lysidine(34) synthetase TilS [Nitrospiraceae bacterium]|nr:tRNA lysidine(34) synthetase TilS [Nitrospiraceae bacterium]
MTVLMDIPGQVKKTIDTHSMLSREGGNGVLIGLSGGADSVCLMVVLSRLKDEYGLKLHAVYIDHGLRPDETPGEAAFAKNLCQSLGVEFHTEKINVISYAEKEGLGKQEAARELRYKAFDSWLVRLGLAKIAVAHNADDQAETFLMRFLRGAGPKGLSAIPPVRGKIIRPLIETPRAEIEEFLGREEIGYITDPSNLKEDYLRNRIRLSVVPVLKEINPSFVSAATRTANVLAEEERYFESVVLKTIMRLLHNKADGEVEFFLSPLESLDIVILRRVLRKMLDITAGLRGVEFTHIEDIIKLVKKGAPGDRINLPHGVRAIKKYSTFLITTKVPSRVEPANMEGPGELEVPGTGKIIKVYFAEKGFQPGEPKKTYLFDADRVSFPLVIRARQDGDFFCPAGLAGSRKKLQDFFVDEKVPRDQRDAVPLIISGEDIMLVCGMRADERFKPTDETRRLLVIECRV